MMKNLELYLQLFADAAEGDTAQFTGENEAAAAPQATGEETPSAAGMEDLDAEFAQLIKGKYRTAYNQRVQETLQKRLRDHKELTQKLEALTPVLETLHNRCGVDTGDVAALQRAVEAMPSRQDRVVEQQSIWAKQAAETQNLYPGFDLGKELENPVFRKLLQSDVPVQTAYEVLHRDQLLPGALAHTAFTVERKLANNLAAMGNRPAESAMDNRGANPVRNDVSQMSRKDREEIIRRVRKGETIRF